jgi:hypothetical protein
MACNLCTQEVQILECCETSVAANISADGDNKNRDNDSLANDSLCDMFEATIQEGKAILQEVAGGEDIDSKNDALMGNETAHKKRSKDDIYDKNFEDADL